MDFFTTGRLWLRRMLTRYFISALGGNYLVQIIFIWFMLITSRLSRKFCSRIRLLGSSMRQLLILMSFV
ncbi:hypothetical protein ABD05_17975 [Burkholderia pyrrocinia]|nr:hypothetical protein ABD05_17975 [Burkholderia pyrrocinia]